MQLTTSFSLLASCGVNTKDWPRIEFEFEPHDLVSLTVCFKRKPNRYADYLEDTIVFNDEKSIGGVMELISGIPYKKEVVDDIEEENYATKLVMDFDFADESIENKSLKFYEYGISNAKVVFTNGDIHFLLANIEGLYEEVHNEYQAMNNQTN